jgi:WD40 repeat protein
VTAGLAAPHSGSGATQPGPLKEAEGGSARPGADAPAGGLPAVPGYRVQREIARGGMGRVLAALDLSLDRDVALKVLLPGANTDRFVRESKITARLPHPGIPPVYALGTLADGSPFLAMKLIAGQTLADEMKHADRPRLLQAFVQVCQAVGFAHSRGIIHRDLKPANVMVGTFGEVQVMDWGLAKVLSAGGEEAAARPDEESLIRTIRKEAPDGLPGESIHTLAGSVLGTPAYMPPEQALGEVGRLEERADVFGLGAILCEVLTGKPPYVGRNSTEVLHQASSGKLDACHERLQSCGAEQDLIDLARECLAAEPGDRPRHAGVVADRVSAYLASVESRLRSVEMQRVAEAARAEEALHTATAAEAKARAERLARRWQLGLAVVVVALTGLGGVAAAWAAMHQSRLKQDALAAEQRAEEARLDALDQTYLATRNEIQSMRLARPSGWRATALERLQGLVHLGSRNCDRVELRSEALACLAELGIRLEKNFGRSDIGAWELRYSPDGQTLAINDDKKSCVLLQDLANSRELPSIPKSLGRAPFAFHPSGTLAVASAVGRVSFHPLNAKGPSFPAVTADGHALNLSFSRSGDRLAVAWGEVRPEERGAPGSYRRVSVHDTATGRLLRAINLPKSTPSTYKTALALSPDGRSLATVGPGWEVQVYAVEGRGEPVVLGRLDDRICALAFHPDGRTLLAGARRVAALWDIASRTELRRLHATEEGLWDIAFSPDGQLLAGACNDRVVKLWDYRTGRELASVPSDCGPCCLSVAFSPRGDQIAVGAATVTLFEVQGRRECRYEASQQNGVSGFAFDPTRPVLFEGGADRFVHLWDLKEPVARNLRETRPPGLVYPRVIRLSPDGRQLAVGPGAFDVSKPDEDYSIRVWRVDDPATERRLKGPQTVNQDVAFSPSGRRLAACSWAGDLYLWELETGTLRYQQRSAGIKAIAFLDEAHLLAATTDHLKVLAVNDGAVRREGRLPTAFATFAVTSDRKEVLVATTDGSIHRARLADLAIEQSRRVLERPSNLTLALSPDGALLAVSTRAGTRTLLIDPRGLETLARLPEQDRRIWCLEFDHGSRYLALGGSQVILWDLGLVRAELARIGLALEAGGSPGGERRKRK